MRKTCKFLVPGVILALTATAGLAPVSRATEGEITTLTLFERLPSHLGVSCRSDIPGMGDDFATESGTELPRTYAIPAPGQCTIVTHGAVLIGMGEIGGRVYQDLATEPGVEGVLQFRVEAGKSYGLVANFGLTRPAPVRPLADSGVSR